MASVQVENVDKRKAEEPLVEESNKKAKIEVNLAAVRKQIEYYFSDDNLSVDAFFHGKICESEDRWLDVNLLLSCRKVKDLHAVAEHVLEALKESPLETKVGDDGVVVAVRRTEALPELKPRGPRFEKKKAPAHEGGVIFKVSNIPEGKKWGDVKDLLKVLLPQGAKVVFATSVNGEGEDRHCVMLTSVFENHVEFIKNVVLEFDLGESKVALKIEILEGDDLKKALVNMPKHVQKKRQDAARNSQKARQKPIVIGEHTFVNVNSLRAKMKEILGARTNGQALRTDSPDFQIVKAVLQYHPRANEKLAGMNGLKVDKHADCDSRCFYVVKEDGSAEDISIMKCIAAIDANPPVAPEKKAEEKKVEEAPKAEEKPVEEAPKAEEKPVEEAPKVEEVVAETTSCSGCCP